MTVGKVFAKMNLQLFLGLLFLGAVLFFAITAPFFTPYTSSGALGEGVSYGLHHRLEAPSSTNLFGTDQLGRDVWTRVLYGARISLVIGLLVRFGALFVGTSIGLVAGYAGGLLDKLLMRTTDLVMAFPSLLLAVALSVALGPGLPTVAVALITVGWTDIARVVRSQTIQIRNQEYVQAGRALGASHLRLIIRYVLPNSLGTLIVLFTVGLAWVIMAEASLSFLGLGASSSTTPSWGYMIYAGKDYLSQAPWVVFGPALFLGFTVLGCNLLGDALRDILDPRLKR